MGNYGKLLKLIYKLPEGSWSMFMPKYRAWHGECRMTISLAPDFYVAWLGGANDSSGIRQSWTQVIENIDQNQLSMGVCLKIGVPMVHHHLPCSLMGLAMNHPIKDNPWAQQLIITPLLETNGRPGLPGRLTKFVHCHVWLLNIWPRKVRHHHVISVSLTSTSSKNLL